MLASDDEAMSASPELAAGDPSEAARGVFKVRSCCESQSDTLPSNYFDIGHTSHWDDTQGERKGR